MNKQPPKDPKRLKTAPKSVVRRRRILLVAAGVALVFLIGVIIWKCTVRPPDINKPTSGMQDDKPDQNEPEHGRDYYEGDLIKPFVEDGDKTRREDFYTFLLCGTDEDELRTDTIIVAAYDVKNRRVNMVNIPRDTISNVKRKIKKINGAFYGGVDQLREELQMLLGFRIDRSVVINFKGFEDLVDAIGGVEFDVPVRMLYTDPTQDLYIDLLPGMQKLDGKKALQLIRFRQNNPGVPGGYPGGDIERIDCQQSFLRAVAKKLLDPSSLLKVSDIASAILSNTETDMSMGELMWLGIEALSMNADSISMSVLPGEARYLWEADFGHMQSYFVPDEEAVLELINEKLNPYNEPVTELNLMDMSRYSSSRPVSSPGGSGGRDDEEGEDDEPPEEITQPSNPGNEEPPEQEPQEPDPGVEPGEEGGSSGEQTPEESSPSGGPQGDENTPVAADTEE